MRRRQVGKLWRKANKRPPLKYVLLVGGPKHGARMRISETQTEVKFGRGPEMLLYRRVCKNEKNMWVFEYVDPELERETA